MDFDDVRLWIQRIWNDSSSHKTFTEVTLRVCKHAVCISYYSYFHAYYLKRFKMSANSPDTENLSHLCRIFYLCDAALDMISLHSRISDLIFQALLFLQESDCETVGKGSKSSYLSPFNGPCRRPTDRSQPHRRCGSIRTIYSHPVSCTSLCSI